MSFFDFPAVHQIKIKWLPLIQRQILRWIQNILKKKNKQPQPKTIEVQNCGLMNLIRKDHLLVACWVTEQVIALPFIS